MALKRSLRRCTAAAALALLCRPAPSPRAGTSASFRSHVDFDAVAAAGPSALPGLDRARARTVQGQVHHRRWGGTAEGDAGDRADQAQVRRQPGVFAAERAGLELLLRLSQRSRARRRPAISSPTCSSPRVSRAPQFDSTDPSFSSERHTTSLLGSGLVELLAREMTADLQAERARGGAETPARRARTSRPISSAKGVRFGSLTAHPDGLVELDRARRRRRRSHRAAVQPQGRVHLAAPVHHQRAQHPSRHGGVGAVRRALDGQPRFRRERRAGRGDARRRLRARRVPGDAAAADRQTRPARGLARRGGGRARNISTSSAARPAIARRLPLKSLVFTDPAPYDMAGTLRAGEVKQGHRDRSGAVSVRGQAEAQRKGRVVDPAVQRSEAPSRRRRRSRLARQRIAGAAFRRTRRVSDAAAMGRRLDGALRPSRRFPHARTRSSPRTAAKRGSRATLISAAEGERETVIAFLRSLVIEAP